MFEDTASTPADGYDFLTPAGKEVVSNLLEDPGDQRNLSAHHDPRIASALEQLQRMQILHPDSFERTLGYISLSEKEMLLNMSAEQLASANQKMEQEITDLINELEP